MTAKTRKQQIEEMLEEDPNDPFLRYGLAMEWMSAGDDEQAVRCLLDLIQSAPQYVPAYLQIGQAYLRLGRPEDARRVLSTGVTVAEKEGEQHAAEEMQALLGSIR